MDVQLPIAVLTQQLMDKTLKEQMLALPFARDIFLVETHVAGIVYYQAGSVKTQLLSGLVLCLRREPSNQHDDLAIEVLTDDGIKLGYVPRNRNPVLARLMDAGKLLVAEVTQIGEWYRQTDIRIKITLRDG